jgi:hypothetical protein
MKREVRFHADNSLKHTSSLFTSNSFLCSITFLFAEEAVVIKSITQCINWYVPTKEGNWYEQVLG